MGRIPDGGRIGAVLASGCSPLSAGVNGPRGDPKEDDNVHSHGKWC
jgi:hypothetical protein